MHVRTLARCLTRPCPRVVHALARVLAVVYSTCSIHRAENEDVVAAVLAAKGDTWQLVKALPEWPTRGLADAPGGSLCVRAGASDETHGFFVARFERREKGSDVRRAKAAGGLALGVVRRHLEIPHAGWRVGAHLVAARGAGRTRARCHLWIPLLEMGPVSSPSCLFVLVCSDQCIGRLAV